MMTKRGEIKKEANIKVGFTPFSFSCDLLRVKARRALAQKEHYFSITQLMSATRVLTRRLATTAKSCCRMR